MEKQQHVTLIQNLIIAVANSDGAELVRNHAIVSAVKIIKLIFHNFYKKKINILVFKDLFLMKFLILFNT